MRKFYNHPQSISGGRSTTRGLRGSWEDSVVGNSGAELISGTNASVTMTVDPGCSTYNTLVSMSS